MQNRKYQSDAANAVCEHWSRGIRRVVLVSPTGSGKTHMGKMLVEMHGGSTLWVVHRDELVVQAEERVPGVTVCTIQGLVSRQDWPEAQLVVFDEAHHMAAAEWSQIVDHYPEAQFLGLTATPERADGLSLGGLFQELVLAVQPSQLLRDGYLVPCRVFQPPQSIRSRQLALCPVEAYKRHADEGRAFVYVSSVKQAHSMAAKFCEAGIPAAAIEANTKREVRRRYVEMFKDGRLQVLTNAHCLTEGVDVPGANVCILARNVSHPSMYLQIVGRVLRAAKDKTMATLIDLVGASSQHGLPLEDRGYSLHGDAIKRSVSESLTVCLHCGYTYISRPHCPGCGKSTPKKVERKPQMLSLILRELWAGKETPAHAKREELDSLRWVAKMENKRIEYVIKRYRDLFGENPPADAFDEDDKQRALESWRAEGRRLGRKIGYAAVRFNQAFGHWPNENRRFTR